MEEEIERRLRAPAPAGQAELKQHVRELNEEIARYERAHYDADDPRAAGKVREWRRRIFEIIKTNRELPEGAGEPLAPGEAEGVETLRIMNRQLAHADANQRLLEKSTLKLVGLDYSCGDIERAIADTRRRMDEWMGRERKERRNVLVAFVVFLGVCLYVLVDRMFVRQGRGLLGSALTTSVFALVALLLRRYVL